MRRLTSFIIVSMMTLLAFAIPAKRTTFVATQSDGTRLTLMLVGDEHMHYYINVDTKEKMLRGANGDYYAMSESVYNERRLAANARMKAANQARTKRMNARRPSLGGDTKARKAPMQASAYTGKKKVLVILVQFADASFAKGHDVSTFDAQFNEPGYNKDNHVGSVHDYFLDQSYGKFDLEFDVVGPVTLANNMEHYGAPTENGNDVLRGDMIAEACLAVDSEVDFSAYDWNGNGEVDQVYVIYAGYGQNVEGTSENTIWPHEWDLYSAHYFGQSNYDGLVLDGKRINTYACSAELAGNSGTDLIGIGTVCHEFSHCLGLPDFYDTSAEGAGAGMSYYDIMDSGCYNGPERHGEVPSGYTAYERYFAGWLEPEWLEEPVAVRGMKPVNDEPEAYILFADESADRFYMFENRKAEKWFSYFAEKEAYNGLFVTYTDESNKNAWNENKVNTDPDNQGMTWVGTTGELSYSESGQDFFPGPTRTYHLTLSDHALSDIAEDADGNISFLFDGGGVVDDGARYTITFNPGTGTCETETWTQSSYGESPTQLPVATAPYGWTFVGWTTTEVAETSKYPAEMYYSSGSIGLTEDITLYAVYKSTSAGETMFQYETSTIAGKEYLLVTQNAEGKAYLLDANNIGTTAKKSVPATEVQIETVGGKATITATPASAIWTLSGSATSMQLKNGDNYLKINGSGVSLAITTSNVYWDSKTGLYGMSNSKTTSYFAQPANADIAFSATTGSQNQRLYMFQKKAASTITVYATNPGNGSETNKPAIAFDFTEKTMQVGDSEIFEATVTNSTGKPVYSSSNPFVASVGENTGRVVAHEVGETTISASISDVSKPAKYKLTVTMPELSGIEITSMPNTTTYFAGECFSMEGMTITAVYANGYKEPVELNYTLSPDTKTPLTTADTQIKVSYTENGITKETVIPISVVERPLYTVTFNAGSGSCTTTSLRQETAGEGFTLPSATGVSEEWTLAGWATESIETTTTRPVLLTPGTTYVPTADITLYAVYSQTTSSGDSGEYVRVESELKDWSGDYLIAYSDTTFADGRLSGKTGIGKANSSVNPGDKLSGNTISAEWGDTYHVTFEKCIGGYAMKTQDGLYNFRESKNGITVNKEITAAETNPITFTFVSEENITISSKGAAFQFNNTDKMFRFYANSNQSPVYLYKKQGTIGTTTYATSPTGATLAEPTLAFAEPSDKAMLVGDTYTNVATADNSAGNISYSSSDTDVAIVDQATGEVTAIGIGSATITAYLDAVAGISKSATATYNVSITMPELTGIEITNYPNRREYGEGEKLSNEGLELELTYANGYTKAVDTGFSTTPADGTPLALSDNTVTVSYTEGEVTLTATYDISVSELPKYAVTFIINGQTTIVSQTIANTGVIAPTVDDITTTIDGKTVVYTFAGWNTEDVAEETTDKQTFVSLAEDGTYTPSEDVTFYAVYKRIDGKHAKGFTLNLEYEDATYYVGAANSSSTRFDSSEDQGMTLYYDNGYLWYKNSAGKAYYAHMIENKADISFTDTKAKVSNKWTMTESDEGVTFYCDNTYRYLALNKDNTRIIRGYGTSYPHIWNLTYTGDTFDLGSTTYFTSYPVVQPEPQVATIANLVLLIEQMKEGNKTPDDVKKMVEELLGK